VDEATDRDRVPKTYADTVEEQAEFEQLVREKGDYEDAVEAEAHDEKPRSDDEAVSGT
jgi:hypothetical protein